MAQFNFSALTSATNPATTTSSGSTGFSFNWPSSTSAPATSAPAVGAASTSKPAPLGISFAVPSSSQPRTSKPDAAATNAAAAPTLGSALGSSGFNLGGTTTNGGQRLGSLAAPAAATGGFTLGGQTTSSISSGGLTLGGSTAPSTGTGGLTLAGQTTSTTGTGGLTLGGQTAASKSSGLTLSGFPTTTTSSGGFLLGGATSKSSGLTLGGITTTTGSSGLGLTATTTAKTTSGSLTLTGFPSSGLLTAKSTATTTTTTSSGGLTLGGLGGTSGTSTSTSGAVVKGLGGVDPSTNAQASSKTAGASGEGKRVKEENMPNELVDTVTKFKAYVKEQKDMASKISVVSNQQMTKVKDQTVSLKQLLSTVAVGLHRNVVALDKLKKQTSQELRNVEMAHRTMETPAALQYENNAPQHYFYELLESFDNRMALYRRLIEDTEGYVVGSQEGAAITPRDLFVCLKRLHETFLALAAQLQTIHEEIKEQKEQYLAYRKVFHNDETDVFANRKKSASNKSEIARTSQPLGPTPFSGLSDYAAMMMSAALNQPAQPQGGVFAAATQPPTTGLFSGGASTGFSGFGAAKPTLGFGATTSAAPAFGFPAPATSAPGFGFPSASTAAVKPSGFGFGSTTTTGASTTFGFGSAATSKQPSFGFGSTPAQTGTSLFGSQTTAAVKPLGLALPTQNLNASAPFNLQPVPSKRPSK